MHRPTLFFSLALLAAAPAAAQLSYDLVEISGAPGPFHPGIDFVFEVPNLTEIEAGGLAVADVDDDGWLDVMLPAPEGQASHLYINQQDGTFAERAVEFGVAEIARRRATAAFFDMDNDGDLDLLTVGYPGLDSSSTDLFSLFRNDGPPDYHFTEVTESAGGFSFSATTESTTIGDPGGLAIADVDRNGYLDIFATWWQDNDIYGGGGGGGIIHNLKDQPRLFYNWPNPDPAGSGQTDYSSQLLIDGCLTSGLDSYIYGLIFMPTFLDVNRDGWPDLHLNVEAGPDLLRLNDGTGAFETDIGSVVGLNANEPFYGNEMGVAVADYDNDLDQDMLVTNAGFQSLERRDILYRNDSILQLGDAGIAFTDVSALTGVNVDREIGWGAVFADLDNDGDLDLLRGRGLDHPVANTVYANLWPQTSGPTVAFADVSDQLVGFTKAGLPATDQDIMRGLVAADFDNDGDLDIFATRTGWAEPWPNAAVLHAGVFLNTLSSSNHWLQVDLRETGGSRNTVGAQVWARSGGPNGTIQMREVRAGESFLSQSPARQHFGLGDANADWVAVRWFDGALTVWVDGLPSDALITIARGTEDARGDVNGDGVVDCTDVELFDQALSQPLIMNTTVPDWPWRIAADVDGNGFLDDRDLGLMTLRMASPWCPVGGGVAGSHGIPGLDGSGALVAGEPITITLDEAVENSQAWIIAGLSSLNDPFHGGLLVPAVDILIGPLPTGATGTVPLAGTWPAALPAGTELWLQAWIFDPAAAPDFYSGSHGIKTTTP